MKLKDKISLLLAALAILAYFFCPFMHGKAQANNTATNLGSFIIKSYHKSYTVKEVLASIDTTGTDLTIYAPSQSLNSVCVYGMYIDNTLASTLSIKLDGTNYIALNLAANQLIYDKQGGNGLSICTIPGSSLIIKASAVMPSMLFYIVEDSWFNTVGN